MEHGRSVVIYFFKDWNGEKGGINGTIALLAET